MTSIRPLNHFVAVAFARFRCFVWSLLRGIGAVPAALGRGGDGAEPVVVLVAFGPPGRRDRLRCDLALVETTCLEHVAEVVGFAHRRRLPVDVWVVTGLSSLPLRAREIRRWLCALLEACPGLRLEIDTSDLLEADAARLADALRRHRFAVAACAERSCLRVGPLVAPGHVPSFPLALPSFRRPRCISKSSRATSPTTSSTSSPTTSGAPR